MKSITIHGIDEPLDKLIRSRARSEGLSINKCLKKILEESLGAKPRGKHSHRGEFDEFCGVWNKKKLSEFEENIKDMTQIDPEDWK